MCFLTSRFHNPPSAEHPRGMGEHFSWRGSVCVSSLGVCHVRIVPSLQHLSHARSLRGRSARPLSGKTTSVAVCSHSETNSAGLMLINWNACRHMGYLFHFCPLALSPLTHAHTHPLAAHSPSECEPKWKWCIVVSTLCKASLTHRDRNEQRHGHCSCKTLSECTRVCVCQILCVGSYHMLCGGHGDRRCVAVQTSACQLESSPGAVRWRTGDRLLHYNRCQRAQLRECILWWFCNSHLHCSTG